MWRLVRALSELGRAITKEKGAQSSKSLAFKSSLGFVDPFRTCLLSLLKRIIRLSKPRVSNRNRQRRNEGAEPLLTRRIDSTGIVFIFSPFCASSSSYPASSKSVRRLSAMNPIYPETLINCSSPGSQTSSVWGSQNLLNHNSSLAGIIIVGYP